MSRTNKLLTFGELLTVIVIISCTCSKSSVDHRRLFKPMEFMHFKCGETEYDRNFNRKDPTPTPICDLSEQRLCNIFNKSELLFQLQSNANAYRTFLSVNNFQYAFNLLYATLAASVTTILALIVFSVIVPCTERDFTNEEIVAYEILIFIWAPITCGLLWMITIGWSDNEVLTYYSRPTNWTMATIGCVSIILFLLVDIVSLFHAQTLKKFLATVESSKNVNSMNLYRENIPLNG